MIPITAALVSGRFWPSMFLASAILFYVLARRGLPNCSPWKSDTAALVHLLGCYTLSLLGAAALLWRFIRLFVRFDS